MNLNPAQQEYVREQWVEYSIGMCILAMRFYARWKVVGFSNFSWDDLFAGISMVFYTLTITLIQFILHHGQISAFDENTIKLLSPAQVTAAVKGSKAGIAAWILYVSLVWTLKGQVLGYYNRLSAGTKQHKWVKIMAVICVLSWLALMLFILCRCTPISMAWQVPGDRPRCLGIYPQIITLMVLNITNDVGLVLIPTNLLWSAKIPLRRKLLIALILSSSFFIIACALLRGLLGRGDNLASMRWGSRELFVSVLVVSTPPIVPLFSKPAKAGYSYGHYTSRGSRGKSKSSNGQKPIPLRDVAPERYGASAKDVDEQSFGSRKELVRDFNVRYGKGVNVTTEIAISDSNTLPEIRDTGEEGSWPGVISRVTGPKRPE